MGGVPVDNLIYGSFVKMKRLEKIVYETYSNSSIQNATTINVFVDLYSVLKSIFSEHYRTEITENTAITSCIINLCSHYRKYFKTLSVHTNFYLIASYNTCDINRKFVAKYNEVFKAKSEIKLFSEFANTNFDLLNLLCPYLPDIYFIRSYRNFESSVIIADLIEKINDGNPIMILSKDLYPLQLTAIYPNTSYLYPIKRRGGIDESLMVPINEKYDYVDKFWELVSSIRTVRKDVLLPIQPINFSMLMALNRFPERNIEAILNITGASKILSSIRDGNEVFISDFESDSELSKLPVNIIDARLKVLDVRYMLPIYRNDPESIAYNLMNLRDDGTINQINAKFFADNPIDLQNL